MNNTPLNAYLGIGIFPSYLRLLETLDQKLAKTPYNDITLIVADTPHIQYNNDGHTSLETTKMITAITSCASRFVVAHKTIHVESWSFLDSNSNYCSAFARYIAFYNSSHQFRNDVVDLVKKNTHVKKIADCNTRAKYVLSELAAIVTLADSYIKLGIKQSEEPFDTLAMRYPVDHVLTKEHFVYID
jgi:hypothetical protein